MSLEYKKRNFAHSACQTQNFKDDDSHIACISNVLKSLGSSPFVDGVSYPIQITVYMQKVVASAQGRFTFTAADGSSHAVDCSGEANNTVCQRSLPPVLLNTASSFTFVQAPGYAPRTITMDQIVKGTLFQEPTLNVIYTTVNCIKAELNWVPNSLSSMTLSFTVNTCA